MKHIEKRYERYIRFDNGNPHLVEAVIRQIMKEGKVAHVIVEAQYEKGVQLSPKKLEKRESEAPNTGAEGSLSKGGWTDKLLSPSYN